ncbi:MAG TPA: hypothetical protein P5136_00715 [Methanofastidiosum sp.]|nr:hypothetical protein [Methanofastidiosum sp.]
MKGKVKLHKRCNYLFQYFMERPIDTIEVDSQVRHELRIYCPYHNDKLSNDECHFSGECKHQRIKLR